MKHTSGARALIHPMRARKAPRCQKTSLFFQNLQADFNVFIEYGVLIDSDAKD
jgi:hypothetical protein